MYPADHFHHILHLRHRHLARHFHHPHLLHLLHLSYLHFPRLLNVLNKNHCNHPLQSCHKTPMRNSRMSAGNETSKTHSHSCQQGCRTNHLHNKT